jgi:hypothetical protein
MTVKVAISLPEDQFRLMEKRRRTLKVSRSFAVRQALSQWLGLSRELDAIRRYVEGYRRAPESPEGWKSIEQVQAEGVAGELGHEAW